jgi:hypothetical protein
MYGSAMHRALLVALISLAACGGPKHGDTSPPTGGAASDAGVASAPDAGDAVASASPTRPECEQLVDHILAMGMAEQRKAKPADQVPTDEQVATIRAKMVEELVPQCLQFTRASWQCAMAAETQQVLYDCAQ